MEETLSWKEIYEDAVKAFKEKRLDSYWVQEHEAKTGVRTAYHSLGATSAFLDYLKKQAVDEVNDISLEDSGIGYFLVGGSDGQQV